MSSTKDNNAFAKLTMSYREFNDIRALSIISPPRSDAHIPGHRPSKPLRLLSSASFRSNSPVVYVREGEESAEDLQALAAEPDSSEDESSIHEKKAKYFRKFLQKLQKVTAIFRSFKLQTFLSRL